MTFIEIAAVVLGLALGLCLGNYQLMCESIENTNTSPEYLLLSVRRNGHLLVFPFLLQLCLGALLLRLCYELFGLSPAAAGDRWVVILSGGALAFALGGFLAYAPQHLGIRLLREIGAVLGRRITLSEKTARENQKRLKLARLVFKRMFLQAVRRTKNKDQKDIQLGPSRGFWRPPDFLKSFRLREQRLRIIWERFKYQRCNSLGKDRLLDSSLQDAFWTASPLLDHLGPRELKRLLFSPDIESPSDSWQGEFRRIHQGSADDREADSPETQGKRRLYDSTMVRRHIKQRTYRN